MCGTFNIGGDIIVNLLIVKCRFQLEMTKLDNVKVTNTSENVEQR